MNLRNIMNEATHLERPCTEGFHLSDTETIIIDNKGTDIRPTVSQRCGWCKGMATKLRGSF